MFLYRCFYFFLFFIFLMVGRFCLLLFFEPVLPDFTCANKKLTNISYHAAIVSILSGSRYLEYVKKLGSSLTRHVGIGNVDRILLVMNYSQPHEDLKKAGWEQIMDAIWNLTEYDLILYMDEDTLVVNDISPLFTIWGPSILQSSIYSFAAVLDQAQQVSFTNAGVLLLRPNSKAYDFFIGKPPHGGLKENIGLHMQLDMEYNVEVVTAFSEPWLWPSKPRILHYPKPEACRVTHVESLCETWQKAPTMRCF